MRDRVSKVVVALVVLLLLPGVSHALTHNQKVLVGLTGVCVVVEEIKTGIERLGLTAAQIKTDVELRLRTAGVRVLTKEETGKTPGAPFLYVDVNAKVRQDSPLVTYSVRVELLEIVTLARGFGTTGGIWDKASIGSMGVGNIREIRTSVGDLVNEFINDYLAANPKK